MIYRRKPLIVLAALIFSPPFLIATIALAAEPTTREIPIQASPELKALGLKATTTTTRNTVPTGNAGPGPVANAFVTFETPFYGVLQLRGYDKGDNEVARNAQLRVNKAAHEGGHIQFAFDAPTNMAKITHFTLTGERRRTSPHACQERRKLWRGRVLSRNCWNKPLEDLSCRSRDIAPGSSEGTGGDVLFRPDVGGGIPADIRRCYAVSWYRP